MYMDVIKRLAKNEKGLGTLIKTIRRYRQDTGMKFGREKCTMWSGKDKTWKE